MNNLTKQELEMQETAVLFIKNNKKLLIQKFVNPKIYTPRNEPISIFMAGIPGAGKTEVSKRLIEELKTKPVRIDADDIRELFRHIGYDGENSYVFQKACSHGVDKLFDYVQNKKLHVIMDGTFATKNSIQNIERSINRNRKVIINYIYQDPVIAWKITKGRELLEGRKIPKNAFVNAYFESMKNVNDVKKKFGEAVQLNIMIKNAQNNMEKQYLNKDNIDSHLEKIYNFSELNDIII